MSFDGTSQFGRSARYVFALWQHGRLSPVSLLLRSRTEVRHVCSTISKSHVSAHVWTARGSRAQTMHLGLTVMTALYHFSAL